MHRRGIKRTRDSVAFAVEILYYVVLKWHIIYSNFVEFYIFDITFDQNWSLNLNFYNIITLNLTAMGVAELAVGSKLGIACQLSVTKMTIRWSRGDNVLERWY